MQVTIARIDQTLDLGSRQVANYLVLQLPNGTEVRVAVTEAEIAQVLDVDASEALGDGDEVLRDVKTADLAPPDLASNLVHWPSLSDEQLQPRIKNLLAENSVPAVLEMEELINQVRSLAQLKSVQPEYPPGPAVSEAAFIPIPMVPTAQPVNADEDGVSQL